MPKNIPILNVSLLKAEAIYKLHYIFHTIIRVAANLTQKGPVQCGNCQNFGCINVACHLPPGCMRCCLQDSTAAICNNNWRSPPNALIACVITQPPTVSIPIKRTSRRVHTPRKPPSKKKHAAAAANATTQEANENNRSSSAQSEEPPNNDIFHSSCETIFE